jgi:hypothetical protein
MHELFSIKKVMTDNSLNFTTIWSLGASQMLNFVMGIILLSFSILIPVSGASAGDKEDAVIASCAPYAANYYAYGACVAKGLAWNEANTCISTPSNCFGENNEIRKAFCAVGVGCPSAPYINELKWVLQYNSGCIAVFKSGTYFSPDCQNLRGRGQTANVWGGKAQYIRAMVIFRGCVITAFHSAIHRSCDGYNLGGTGGNSTKTYDGAPVVSMRVVNSELHTVFSNNPCYRDTTGRYPAGGDPAVSGKPYC